MHPALFVNFRQWIGIGFLIVLCSLSVAGQAGSPLGGPTLGFITDENGATIWPLLGVLGAAVPGQPLELSHAIVNATFSPQNNFALAIAAANTQPVLIRLDVSNPQIYSLPGARFNPGLIAISPAGGSAALYDRGSMVLQLLSGLPDSPRIAYEFDMSPLGGEVRGVAVSDDASLALVNTGNEGAHRLAHRCEGASVACECRSTFTNDIHRQPSRCADCRRCHAGSFSVTEHGSKSSSLVRPCLARKHTPVRCDCCFRGRSIDFRVTDRIRGHLHHGSPNQTNVRCALPLQADSISTLKGLLCSV